MKALMAALVLVLSAPYSHAGPVEDAYGKCMTRHVNISNGIISGCRSEAVDEAQRLLYQLKMKFLKKYEKGSPEEVEDAVRDSATLINSWKMLIGELCSIEGRWVGQPLGDICEVELLDIQVTRYQVLVSESIDRH